MSCTPAGRMPEQNIDILEASVGAEIRNVEETESAAVKHADEVQEKNQRTKKEQNASQQIGEAPAWWIFENDIAWVRTIRRGGKSFVVQCAMHHLSL